MISPSNKPGRSSQARVLKPSVSLATLSEHLGLSKAAISRVLNSAPAARSIPQSTQDRIFAAARQFRYRPNVLARSLRRGHSMTIGVLVPEISEGYATLVLAGIEDALFRSGYVLLLVSHHHQKEVIDHAQSMLAERAVDGIIAIDTVLAHDSLLPTVTVSCPSSHEGVTNIVVDQKRAADLALEHLFMLGHRKIAIIRGQNFSSDSESRWQAITDTAARLGIAIDPCLVATLEGDTPTHEPGYLATQRLLATKNRFSALFAFNDVSAIGAIRALREAKLDVPGNVSVVGFDDIQSAGFQNPGLTTVRQPLHAMGMLAAEEILKTITASAEPHIQKIVVEPELVVRDSTETVAAKSRTKRKPSSSYKKRDEHS